MTSEREIESEILAKGLNAPRLTPEKIDAVVAQQYWGRAADLFKGTRFATRSPLKQRCSERKPRGENGSP